MPPVHKRLHILLDTTLQRDPGKGAGEEDPRPGATYGHERSRDRPPKKAEPTLCVTHGQGR